MSAALKFAPIISGLEQQHRICQYVEIQQVRVINAGKSTEYEERAHVTGRLIGTFDKFVNDEIRESSFILAGGGGLHHDRIIKINWMSEGIDPDQQRIQTIEVGS